MNANYYIFYDKAITPIFGYFTLAFAFSAFFPVVGFGTFIPAS
jgi:hypothetical protein